MTARRALRKRGTPLAMLVILMGGWIALRLATWDSSFSFPAMARAPVGLNDLAIPARGNPLPDAQRAMPAPHSLAYPHLREYAQYAPAYGYGGFPYPAYYAGGGLPPQLAQQLATHVVYVPVPGRPLPGGGYLYGSHPETHTRSPFPHAPHLGQGHPRLSGQALATDWRLAAGRDPGNVSRKRGGKRYLARELAPPPFAAQLRPSQDSSKDRWLLDAYGFYRQGSSALSVTQGRQPIYGASQIAANLQWRARPSSSHDPRVYARAYHALVTGGESEFAGGISARPLGKLPLRVFGELRAVRNPAVTQDGVSSTTDFRPAVYAATEIPPQKLPLGFSLEAYGAGGYVGGNANTYFLDGQAAVTRPVSRVSLPRLGSTSVSVGAGVWGGAQEGASRVDVGPTLRFDVDIGKIPARVSVDYREQVAGDAEPDSGVAATVSTRF